MKFNLERYPSNKNPEPILTPREGVDWEAKAVFNPSVVRDGARFRMLYRTYPEKLMESEPRLYRPGFVLKNRISYIGYAESADGIYFERRANPFIAPTEMYDQYGCEDPRITKIDDTFYITYTAIDAPLDKRHEPNSMQPNIRIALATTRDFETVTKHGIIGPPQHSKAAAFFPEQVNDSKIALIMTVAPDSANSRVVVRYFDSMEQSLHSSADDWGSFFKETAPTLRTESWLHRGPELGAVPIKTDRGWLLIYSAESMSDSWTISAALLDLIQPHKLLARLPGYLLQPAASYECGGLIPNVTFPEGAVIVEDELWVYYGCADTRIGLAKCKLEELLDQLMPK